MIARSIRLAQAASSTTSIILLLAFNLIPLAGVLFWGWNIWTLLVLYWVENGVVGVLNIPKILLADGPPEPARRTVDVGEIEPVVVARSGMTSKAALVLFFLVHYGIFWFVHGAFILALPTFVGAFSDAGTVIGFPGGGILLEPGQTLPPGIEDELGGFVGFGGIVGGPRVIGPDLSAVAIGAVGLAISHIGSFVVNFLGRREYRTMTPERQMFAPYGRVVILHLTILFGAFLSLALGSPIGAVVVLVLLKTGVDLWLHLREHGRIGSALPATP